MKNFFSKSTTLVIIPFLLLVIIHILMASQIKVPIVWPDEYFHVFYAKSFLGWFVTFPLPKVGFLGSFGYSMLISPIIAIMQTPENYFTSILYFNSIISSSLYIGLYFFIKKLLNSDNFNSFLISFVISLYPAYLLQSNTAYPSGITPALFIFSILSFHKLLVRKNLIWSIIFSFITGYFAWIHIRFTPLIIICIILIFYLYIKKIIPLLPSLSSVIICLFFLISSSFFNDYIILKLTGQIFQEEKVLTRIFNYINVLILAIICLILVFNLFEKKFLNVIVITAGLLVGLLLHLSPVFLILLLFTVVTLLIIRKRKKLSISKIIYLSLYLIIISFITYYSIQQNLQISDLFSTIKTWIVNASGNLFYAMYATYLLVGIGFIYLFHFLWLAGKKSTKLTDDDGDIIEDFEGNHFSINHFLKNPVNITLLLFFISSLTLFVVTVFQTSFDAGSHRADLIFFGRYIEVVFSGFIAFAIYRTLTSKLSEFLLIVIITFILFYFVSFQLIVSYGTTISTELAFRSVLSIFPLRAIIGNINIFLFAIYTTVFSILVLIFIRLKKIFGLVLLGLLFLVFSALTYNYVILYHQIEQQNKNRLTKFINENFNQLDTIYYDLRINTEYSRNSLNYVYNLSNKNFVFFKPEENKMEFSPLVIANKKYGTHFSPGAILLGIEYKGFDYLWLNSGPLQDSLREKLTPSYFDIPLNYNYIGGIYSSGLIDNRWIKNKAILKFNIGKKDTIFNISFITISNNAESQDFKLLYNNKVVYKTIIEKGSVKHNVKLLSKIPVNTIKFEFISNFSIKNSKINGIGIDSVILEKQNNSQIQNEPSNLNNYISYLNQKLNLDLWFRRNYDLFLIKLLPGNSIKLPITIRNLNNQTLFCNQKNQIYLSYQWLDFIYKQPIDWNSEKVKLSKNINSNAEDEIFLNIKSPEKEGRYFLKLCLLQKIDNKLKIIYESNNEVLFDTRISFGKKKFY